VELRFKFGDPSLQRSYDVLLDFLHRVARRDVLRAIPIERNDVDKKEAFHAGPDFRFGELRD